MLREEPVATALVAATATVKDSFVEFFSSPECVETKVALPVCFRQFVSVARVLLVIEEASAGFAAVAEQDAVALQYKAQGMSQ